MNPIYTMPMDTRLHYAQLGLCAVVAFDETEDGKRDWFFHGKDMKPSE